MISREFRKEEYWHIKWPLLSLVLSIVVSIGLFVALNALNTTATTDLRRARSDLDVARQNVDQIEEEEALIIEYIGRYREMQQDGVMSPKDLLQFQEALKGFRTQYNLFPVSLSVAPQIAIPLQYSEGTTEPGREVILHTSVVEFSLPLLHENDLLHLLASVMDGPGQMQPLSCTLNTNSNLETNYIYLAQHFRATCSLQWYTFQLPPAGAVP